jgi:membrane glycosyltransferase
MLESASAISGSLLLWLLPVVAGLVLAIPLTALTGSGRLGDRLRRFGLLQVPEERRPPPVLVRANELAGRARALDIPDGPRRLLRDDAFVDAHLAMLATPSVRAKGDVDVPLALALAKIAQADDVDDALRMFSAKELFAVLADRTALARLRATDGARDETAPPLSVARAAERR